MKLESGSNSSKVTPKQVVDSFKNSAANMVPEAQGDFGTDANLTSYYNFQIEGNWKLIRTETKEQDGKTTSIDYKDNLFGIAFKFMRLDPSHLEASFLEILDGKANVMAALESQLIITGKDVFDLFVKDVGRYRIVNINSYELILSQTKQDSELINYYFASITDLEFKIMQSIEINN